MAAQVDPLARVLGAGWPRLSWGQLINRAHELDRAASFARTLAGYMDSNGAETAGEAVQAVTGRHGAAADWEIGA